MAAPRSRITAQGQISIPASIRARLGVGPGSVVEWTDEEGKIVVRRAGKYISLDLHRALFGDKKPPRKTLAQLKQGVELYMRERHARR